MINHKRIILASSSPRRKELLRSLLGNFNLTFDIMPANIHERLPLKHASPGRLTIKIAELKSRAVAENNKGIILGADTIVVLKGKILGKPESIADARRMLLLLSSNYHYVYTGLSFIDSTNGNEYSTYEKTKVFFRKLTRKEIDFYINTGSPFDKAGAYGIQDDFGSTFVSNINGDFFNVVGLPIVKTYLGLKKIMDLEL